jgi:hypothetical protein
MKRLLLAFLLLVGPIWADTTMQIRNGVLQTDLNANNFSIINLKLPVNPNDAANKAYVDANIGGGGGTGLPIMSGQAGKFLTTDGTIALWSLIPFSAITSTPTTLVGYGITDPVVLTTGSYSNPTWITSLVWSKITGTPTTLSGYGIATPLPISAIPTGTSSTTVAIGNDNRFSSSVTGLRKSSGLGSTDVAATPNTDYVTPDSAGRTALGLVIGTNVQAFDADLSSLAAISSIGVIPYRSAADTWQTVSIGSGLSFTGGVLSATGGIPGGEITSPSSPTPPYAANVLSVFADATGDVITTGNFTGVPVLTAGIVTASAQLAVANGGTGLSTIALGDILYGSSTNVISRLSANSVSTNKYLRSVSLGAPSWQQIPFSDLSSTPTSISGYGITDSFALANNFSELGTSPGNKATARTNLGVAISGTSTPGDVEAWDADLASFAAIASTNVIPYRSGANTWGTVTIGTGLSFTAGTLAIALGAPDVLSDVITSTDGQLTVFSGTTGKHIRTGSVPSAILKTNASSVVSAAAPNLDYFVGSESTFATPGTSPAPIAWTAGKVVMQEGSSLTIADGYSLLPVANTFAPGTIITFLDYTTTGNFGRNFRPANNGVDKLDGLLFTAWAPNWLRPFIAGGLTPAQGTYQFKTNGADSWVSVYANGRATKVQSPNDARQYITFNVENQPTATHNTINFYGGGDSSTVGDLAKTPGQFVVGFNGSDPTGPTTLGVLQTDAVHPTDLAYREAEVNNAAIIDNGSGAVPRYTYVVTPADGTIDTIRLSATTLPGPVTIYVPPAANYLASEPLVFFDSAGTINDTQTITLVSSTLSVPPDTFNGNPSVTIKSPTILTMKSDGAGNWTYVDPTATSPIIPVSGYLTLPTGAAISKQVDQTLSEQHWIVNSDPSGTTTLTIQQARDGERGYIRFNHNSTGGDTFKIANSGTPSGGGGTLYLSTTANVIDEIEWRMIGTIISARPTALNVTGQVVTCGGSAWGEHAGGTLSAVYNPLGTNSTRTYVANRFTASLGSSPTGPHTTSFCSVRVPLYKSAAISPTVTITQYVFADGGAGTPGALIASSNPIAASSVTATDATAAASTPTTFTYNAPVNLTASTTYFLAYGSSATGSNNFKVGTNISGSVQGATSDGSTVGGNLVWTAITGTAPWYWTALF